jgi:uncharacterized protein
VTFTIGAFLNAIGILIGALGGLVRRQPLSASVQNFFRGAIGLCTIFFGLRLVWLSLNGTFSSVARQIFIALLALTLGNLLGKLLGLQKLSNRLGRFAGNLIANSQSETTRITGDGFIAGTILFCAAPLGIIGAVSTGLSGYFWLLAVKAIMDGLAMTGFVKMFGWPAALSAFSVFFFFGAISLTCQICAVPFLAAHQLINSVNATGGFLACAVTLIIFEIRKVPLANFLPGLAVAPLLAWLIK